MLLNRIYYELQTSTQHLMHSSQHGFVRRRSTETALQELFNEIEYLSQEENYISLISLDFHHAFDNLPWTPTLEELDELNKYTPSLQKHFKLVYFRKRRSN